MKKQNLSYRLLRGALRAFLDIFMNVNVTGLDNVREDQNYVFIGNHSNWIDPILVFAYLPIDKKIALLGEAHSGHRKKFILKLIEWAKINVIVFDRASSTARIKALKVASQVVNNGESLLIFPEGRICRVDGEFYPFFKGSFFIAKRGKSPILPIYIRGTEELYFGRNITLVFGEEIKTEKKSNVEKLTTTTYYYMKNELAPDKPKNDQKKKRCDITYLFLAAPPPIDKALMNIPVANGNSAVAHYEKARELTKKNTTWSKM